MLVTHRPFDDAHGDFAKLWLFLEQDYGDKHHGYVWHVSRLGDWKYGLWNETKTDPAFFHNHAQLWIDPFDQVNGFVLSENGDNVLSIFARQGHEDLYKQILDWTLAHWGARYPIIRTEVHEHQDQAIAALESRGFHTDGQVIATTRAYDLSDKVREPVCVPDGYGVADMRSRNTDADVRSKALLHANGFRNLDAVTERDIRKGEQSHQNPAYTPELDFSLIAADGTHVSTCVGFADMAYRVAEVEKICTHSQHRRRGLAEAAVRTCFHRLHEHGVHLAYITGYSPAANALYEKLGPCGHKRWYHFQVGDKATSESLTGFAS